MRYKGILPDLFREGQGIVATGKLNSAGVFEAEQVLAKHDENYMPPELAGMVQEGGSDSETSPSASQPDRSGGLPAAAPPKAQWGEES